MRLNDSTVSSSSQGQTASRSRFQQISVQIEDLPTLTGEASKEAAPSNQQKNNDGSAPVNTQNKEKDSFNVTPLARQKEAVTERNTTSTSFDMFTCFPELPLEIQYHIWAFASAILSANSPRIFRVALVPQWPSRFGHLAGCAIRGPPLKILPGQEFPVPSLLAVCRDARLAARKDHILWGWGGNWAAESSQADFYINKTYDTIYFGVHSNGKYLYEFLHRFTGIEKLAMDWPYWFGLIRCDYAMKWSEHLPSLTTLTILAGGRTARGPVIIKGNPIRLSTITPNTPHEASAKKFMWWIGKCLEACTLNSSTQSTPQLDIQLLWCQKGDCSEYSCRFFRRSLDARIKDAETVFGKMPEM